MDTIPRHSPGEEDRRGRRASRGSRLRLTCALALSLPFIEASPVRASQGQILSPAAGTSLVAGQSVEVVFAVPQSAVAPGQAVVFYADDRVLGGAWIEETIK